MEGRLMSDFTRCTNKHFCIRADGDCDKCSKDKNKQKISYSNGSKENEED
jgi:hypothetical protein